MSGAIPKVWRIEARDGRYVVRITDAGIVLSDAVNAPTLFDYNTARRVAEQIQGILSLEKIIVVLAVKPQDPTAARAPLAKFPDINIELPPQPNRSTTT